MMIDLGKAFAEYVEPTIAPEGRYDLRIIGVKATMPKEGQPVNGEPKGWNLMIVFEDGNFKPMSHWFPNSGHPAVESWADSAVKKVRSTFKLFNVETDGGSFNPEDMIGLTAENVTVLVEDSDFGMQNRLKLPYV